MRDIGVETKISIPVHGQLKYLTMIKKTGNSINRPAHGSITPAELRELCVSIDDVIDFSSNINPLGVSARVRAAMGAADASRYPDPDCLELREALARRTNVGVENIEDMIALRTADRLGCGAKETSWRTEDFKKRKFVKAEDL